MGRYLVTGCAGFIGSYVAKGLLERGQEVVGVDALDDAYDPRLKRWRLEGLIPLGLKFIHRDVADLRALEEVFSSHGPFDAVINLAARAGVRTSILDPWTYYQANLTGTLNLLELCRRHGVGKFVLASTSSVYGSGAQTPFREDSPTDRPLSPYAASKKAAEALCYTYHHLYGLDITVLRYFTVYGPAGRPDMSYFRFCRWILEGEPVLIYGDGTQRRDFTYIEDITEGTILALKPLGYEVINLGSDRPVAVLEVIRLIGELGGRKPKVEFLPAHRADVPTTWADITKARKLLGWSPKTPLEEGLRRTVSWYLENRPWAKDIRLPPP